MPAEKLYDSKWSISELRNAVMYGAWSSTSHYGPRKGLTKHGFPLSGHTFVRLSCLSCGPVGPSVYLCCPKKFLCFGFESGSC